MKRIRDAVRSRRGVAIELAIIAMLIMIALSLILLTVGINEGKISRSTREQLAEEVELNSIGEWACTLADGEYSKPLDNGANYTAVRNGNDITVSKDGTAVLEIVIEDGVIKSWTRVAANS